VAERGLFSWMPAGLLGVIAALFALSFPHSTTQSAPTASAPSSDTERPVSSHAEKSEGPDPLQPLWDQYGSADGGLRLPASSAVRFLIATVPDPLDSHLANNFDRALEAIQEAMADGEYTLTRWFLPWPSPRAARSSASPDSTPPGLHRRSPGTLVFELDHPPNHLLVVFLVGETPTTGIQQVAFRRALQARENFLRKYPSLSALEKANEIHILGPYFSGSVSSLQASIQGGYGESLTDPNRHFQIISGSATRDYNRKELNREGRSTFQATVIPDLVLQEKLVDYLRLRMHACPKDLAVFVEGGTAYGTGYAGKLLPTEEDRPQRDFFRSIQNIIRFPLHISQLRGAYEKDVALSAPGPLNRGPRRALELSLESPENPTDVLPAQTPRMTANAEELVLSSNIEMLRRDKVRFVGIVGSDTRDILFIARKVREAAADVVLFTFGADILYTHPDFERYLRGMLVVTPYPLLPVNQAWTGQRDSSRRVSFPGSSEEGIYNATLVLLSEVHAADEDRRPLSEYESPLPEGRYRPPVWIMAVGHRGFWPVDVDADYEDQGYVYVEAGPYQPLEGRFAWPPGAQLLLLLSGGGLLALCALYFSQRAALEAEPGKAVPAIRPTTSLASRFSGRVRRFYVSQERGFLAMNRAYLVLLFCPLMLFQVSAAALLFKDGSLFGGAWFTRAFAIAVLLALAACLLSEIARLVRNWPRGQGNELAAEITPPGLMMLLITILLAIFLVSLLSMKPGEWLAFRTRALDLASAITPVWPFVICLAILCLWFRCHLRRTVLWEFQTDFQPVSSIAPTVTPNVGLLAERVDKLLSNPRARYSATLVPLLALIPFYRVWTTAFTTMDGLAWGRLFLVLSLCAYFAVFQSFVCFVMVWRSLRRFLQHLSFHPLAEAFRRLPEPLAKSPWKMWRSVPTYLLLGAAVSELKTLVRLGRVEAFLAPACPWFPGVDAPFEKRLEELADQAEKSFGRALEESEKGIPPPGPSAGSLRSALSEATSMVLEVLGDVWKSWPAPGPDQAPALEKTKDGEPPPNTAASLCRQLPEPWELWVRSAEELVAIRFAGFLHAVFAQMRNLLSYTLVGYILLLAAMNSYPYEPKHPVMALIWLISLVCIAQTFLAFMQMDRDKILSFMGRTDPGRVNFSFEFGKTVVLYGVLPLLTLIATQFPEVGDVLFSVFNPGARAPK
jgi:hypothetical protein